MAAAPSAGAAGEAGGFEPGSFRDPDSRVFFAGGDVLRALSARGAADWRALRDSALFARETQAGRLVATEEIDAPADLPLLRTDRPQAVLRHERIPFVSYPYEWTPGMLRDAALLQLELLAGALDEGLILKDATPYNVQWRGARPVFVDVGSFEPLREGEPWFGYRQFCAMHLNPLLLAVLRDMPFQPWLRGSLEGISPDDTAKLLRGRDRRRRGVLTHVVLHAKLDRRSAAQGRTSGGVRDELKKAGFHSELIKANVKRLHRMVSGLEWQPPKGVWTEYRAQNSYSDADTERKEAFVREVSAASRPGLVWDLGCNDGRFSRIATEAGASYVVAVDGDQAPVELLYRELRDEGRTDILPLTVDLTNPSPGLGWRGLERRPMADRGRPDLVLCLALLHHLAITGNVPVADAVDWLRSLGGSVVVEFVRRNDPMVERLLAAKRSDTHPDYDEAFFERRLGEAFAVERREELPSGTRVLYLARPTAG